MRAPSHKKNSVAPRGIDASRQLLVLLYEGELTCRPMNQRNRQKLNENSSSRTSQSFSKNLTVLEDIFTTFPKMPKNEVGTMQFCWPV